MNKEKDKMDRRSFMVNTAKIVIPTLGILGLTLSGFSQKAFAASCQGSCSGGCAGECQKTCRDICANSCTVGCSSNSK
ncbi:MAG: putative cytosolic protein [Firmicutes bacterium]|nr:putative cytosolic protein [Bacillota bacterium]